MVSSIESYVSLSALPLTVRAAGAAPQPEPPQRPAVGESCDDCDDRAARESIGREPIRPLIDGNVLAAVQQQNPTNAASGELKDGTKDGHGPDGKAGKDAATEQPATGAPKPTGNGEEATDTQGLTEEQQAEVDHLQSEDTRVRNHEAAHANAGGAHAGSPQFTYTTGPDGKRYATSGHVPIDISPVAGDPEATVRKMEQVKRAALAPADPSGADRSVAAQADQAKLEAQREVREQRTEEPKPETPEDPQKAAPDPEIKEPSAAASDDGAKPADGTDTSGRSERDGGFRTGGRDGGDGYDGYDGGARANDFAAAGDLTATRRSDDGDGGGIGEGGGFTSNGLGESFAPTSFTQAIDAYQRAGNVSAGPRFTSLR